MKNGPELWSSILAPIQEAYGSGIIAGGAVRDYLLGREPKDIDVFINVATEEDLLKGMELLHPRFNLQRLNVADDVHMEYERNPDWASEVKGVLDGIFSAEALDDDDFAIAGPRVQIIARPIYPAFTVPALIHRFDIGITRCWYASDLGVIVVTPEAARDIANKTLTLMRWDTEAHVTASMRRVGRFLERDPTFKFVDPRLPDPDPCAAPYASTAPW